MWLWKVTIQSENSCLFYCNMMLLFYKYGWDKLTTQSQNPIKVFQDDDKRNWTWANPNVQIPFKKYWRGDKLAHRPSSLSCNMSKSRGRPCMENARAWWVMGVGCPLSHCHSAHIRLLSTAPFGLPCSTTTSLPWPLALPPSHAPSTENYPFGCLPLALSKT